MKKFLVIGNPIEHSMSPKLHNYWFDKYNLKDHLYEKRKVVERDLKNEIRQIRDNEISGINVTVPFKKSVIEFCDELDMTAELTQSVNTILKKKGKIIGFNTDSEAFNECVRGLINKEKSIFVLGSGGVTASILNSLRTAKKVFISNRTRKKAENLKKIFEGIIDKIEVIEWGNKPSTKCDVVINTTSIGLKKEDKIAINFSDYNGEKIAFIDLIYNQRTHFLKDAEKRGNFIKDGKDMFLGQARHAFLRFTGVLPEVDSKAIKLISYD